MSFSSSQKLRGVFLNQPQAQCSIFESGYMVYKALQFSDRYTLDYFDLDPSSAGKIPEADFYLFNYHHATMSWLKTKEVAGLPGKKITIVLEMLPGNPFVYVSPDDFDAYLVLDPTMNIDNPKVFGFPRPLELGGASTPYIEKPIPWIGTFGFSTPGKGFELVVDAVNREFDRALVRINIPAGTFADGHAERLHRMNYAEYLGNVCRAVAKPGIDVEVSRHFFGKDELIEWCGQNTLNCFLYSRNQPGLSATTDQCITAGRPLSVSANETFRHIHQYLKPYPARSLRESIECSVPEVLRMREDWTPGNFSLRFEEVLAKLGLMASASGSRKWFMAPPPPKRTVLWVGEANPSPERKLSLETTARVANKSKLYAVVPVFCPNEEELRAAIRAAKPDAVVFVSEQSEMPWLTDKVLASLEVPFTTFTQRRVIPLNCNEQLLQEIPVFGAYFPSGPDPRCSDVVELVQDEFDEALIVFYMPTGKDAAAVHAFTTQLRTHVKKPGIIIQFAHEPCSGENLLMLMGYMTLSIFPTPSEDELVFVDYALATQRPIALVDKKSNKKLREVLAEGIAPFVPFYNDWSEARFIQSLEQTLARLDEKKEEPVSVSQVVERFASLHQEPRILGINTRGRVELLDSLPYDVEEIDPEENFTLADFYYLPTTVLNSYNVIFSPDSAHTVEDKEMFLAQLGDLLAPGGVAILTCAPEARKLYTGLIERCGWAAEPEWSGPISASENTSTLVIPKVGATV